MICPLNPQYLIVDSNCFKCYLIEISFNMNKSQEDIDDLSIRINESERKLNTIINNENHRHKASIVHKQQSQAKYLCKIKKFDEALEIYEAIGDCYIQLKRFE